MPTGGQFRELRATMRRLLWKMLRMLRLERFCISISSKTHVTRIVRFTKASESSYWKTIVKKFEMMTIKHTVPNVNWIAQTKVGTK
jgi:hypothetical protein